MARSAPRTAQANRRAAAASQARVDRLNRASQGKKGAALDRNLRNRALAANKANAHLQRASELDKKAGRKKLAKMGAGAIGARGGGGGGSSDG